MHGAFCFVWNEEAALVRTMGARASIRLRILRRIYREAASWACDDVAAARRLDAVDPLAKVVVVGEAVGPKTLRLSGVSYFGPDGRLGATGRYLDEILRSANLTIYPGKEIRVDTGVIHPSDLQRQRVYSTDLCPCFPGYSASRHQKPIRIERPGQQIVYDALKKQFLRRELAVIRPKVIVLLGERAYKHFYDHFLGIRVETPLTALIGRLDMERLPRFKTAVVLPFLHPSPASPAFLRWFSANKGRLERTPFVRRLVRSLGR